MEVGLRKFRMPVRRAGITRTESLVPYSSRQPHALSGAGRRDNRRRMTNLDLTAEFEKYYSIRIPDWWSRGRTLLLALLKGREAAGEAFASATPSSIEAEPTLGVLFHLLEQACEHVAASVVCFATKNAATSEIAARVGFAFSFLVGLFHS
jgi:hypothetical protein